EFFFLIGFFCFFKGFIGFFIGGDNNEVYLYTFPISVIAGLFIIFMFILVIFKTVQLQSFNNSHWVWLFNYTIIALLLVALFYVFFIPQSFLAFGPYILISNWSFIIISAIITPIAFYIQHHFVNKDSNTIL
ncbi:hypothetical protein LLE78_09270, partial [Staphylococcus haemolyticus]|nr:hypothetical protein [Staphylococcus haemolyticus]